MPFISAEKLNLSSVDMDTIKGTSVTLWDYFKSALDWSRGWIMKLAEFIGKYIDFPVENIYMGLLALISLFIISRIFYVQNTTIRGRGLGFIIWSLIVFLILKFL